MSLADRSKREILESYRTLQAQLSVAEIERRKLQTERDTLFRRCYIFEGNLKQALESESQFKTERDALRAALKTIRASVVGELAQCPGIAARALSSAYSPASVHGPGSAQRTMTPRWRQGNKIPLNIYDGDRPVCQCHNPVDAARIVEALNAIAAADSPPSDVQGTDGAQKADAPK